MILRDHMTQAAVHKSTATATAATTAVATAGGVSRNNVYVDSNGNTTTSGVSRSHSAEGAPTDAATGYSVMTGDMYHKPSVAASQQQLYQAFFDSATNMYVPSSSPPPSHAAVSSYVHLVCYTEIDMTVSLCICFVYIIHTCQFAMNSLSLMHIYLLALHSLIIFLCVTHSLCHVTDTATATATAC